MNRMRTMWAGGVLCVLAAASAAPLRAQPLADSDGGRLVAEASPEQGMLELDHPLVEHEGSYIVVHLAENRVYLFEGTRVLWSAPAGTGTGFRLSRGEHRWKFSTPRGLMRVQFMEKDPLWEAPDWHFIEKGLPVPPPDHPSRLIPGGMGTTAIYLGDGIAIHGTELPGLVLNPDPEARRVSHGCIRLTNEAARDLMHRVDVGTPVLIF